MQRILVLIDIIILGSFISQLLIFIFDLKDQLDVILRHWIFVEITLERSQFFISTILMHRALYFFKRVELEANPKYHTVEAIIFALR